MIDFSKKPIFLAPLAGLTDLPFRTIAKKCGCDVSVSEMLSANALAFNSQKTLKMALPAQNESPYIIQIESSQIENIKKAVSIINTLDGIDGIDLNCGCPVPKVCRQGAGSALLENPKLLCNIIETIKKNNTKHYTSVKLRLGINSVILPSFIKDIENAGADFVVIHARTRSGGFSTKPDYESVCRIKELLKIPVIVNGSIDEKTADFVLEKTGANGLMIGRAAIGKPWIFSVLKGEKEPDDKQKKELIKEHFALCCQHYDKHAAAMMRKHLHEYSKGMLGAPEFRTKINSEQDINNILKIIDEFF